MHINHTKKDLSSTEISKSDDNKTKSKKAIPYKMK